MDDDAVHGADGFSRKLKPPARRERPRRRRAAEQRDELAAPHVEHRGGLQPPRVAVGQTAIAIALAAVMVVTGWSIVPTSAGDG